MGEKLIDSRTYNSVQLLSSDSSVRIQTDRRPMFFYIWGGNYSLTVPVLIGGTNKLFLLRDPVENTK